MGRPQMCAPYLILILARTHTHVHYGALTEAYPVVGGADIYSVKFTFGLCLWIYDITLI